MQNRPPQVNNCTHASCFIRAGMAATVAMISCTLPARPAFSFFSRSNAAMSAGGYSLVVSIVTNTHTSSTAAPR